MALFYKHTGLQEQYGEILQEKQKFDAHLIKKYVKGSVTYLELTTGLVMFVNRSAQILHIHFNALATRTVWNSGLIDTAIYGDVLVLDYSEIDDSLQFLRKEQGSEIA